MQANTGAMLVSYLDASHNVDWTTNTSLGMMQGTSPSIASGRTARNSNVATVPTAAPTVPHAAR